MKKYTLITALCLICTGAFAQTVNTSTEVIDYEVRDGKIILPFIVNGQQADFVLDLAGHLAILPESLEPLKIDPDAEGVFNGYAKPIYKTVPVGKIVQIEAISLGNSVFGNEMSAFILTDEPYLRQLGVAGTIGGAIFRNVVLTIDSRRQKITITSPYRPNYIKLDHRANMTVRQGVAAAVPVTLDGKETDMILDTWYDGLVCMPPAMFASLQGAKTEGVVSVGYGQSHTAPDAKRLGSLGFVKSTVANPVVVGSDSYSQPILGREILSHGIISIDFGKNKVYFQPFDLAEVVDDVRNEEVVIEAGKVNPITREYFIQNIFDYRKGGEFASKADKPVVIDFWATWCGPCMRMMPEMEKMAETYKDRVVFLKVNADKEKELCGIYNVVALPTFFIIPPGGKPIIEIGVNPEKIEEVIGKVLNGNTE